MLLNIVSFKYPIIVQHFFQWHKNFKEKNQAKYFFFLNYYKFTLEYAIYVFYLNNS